MTDEIDPATAELARDHGYRGLDYADLELRLAANLAHDLSTPEGYARWAAERAREIEQSERIERRPRWDQPGADPIADLRDAHAEARDSYVFRPFQWVGMPRQFGKTAAMDEAQRLAYLDEAHFPREQPGPHELPKVRGVFMFRDEYEQLPRMLESVLPYLSDAVLVDTGSTDPERMCAFAKAVLHNWRHPIPFSFHRRPWVNFGHNRSEALEIAEAGSTTLRYRSYEWLLLMDADMELVDRRDTYTSLMQAMRQTDVDVWLANAGDAENGYYGKPLLARRKAGPWHYEGVTHEFLESASGEYAHRMLPLQHVLLKDHADGANRAEKYPRDLRLLLPEALKDPSNSRTWFYLAQTLDGMGDDQALFPEARTFWLAAADCYRKAARESTWDEEQYLALVRAGYCYHAAGEKTPAQNTVAYALKLPLSRRRAEADRLAYELAGKGDSYTPSKLYPKDLILFLDPACYLDLAA